jgi:tetratricopeptide (TPR) repeat protein
MAALAVEPTRPSTGRIAGLPYAPAPAVVRGTARTNSSPDVRIAVARLEKRDRERSTPETRAALGVGYLATGDVDGAIEMLQRAANESPAPDTFCDLAAAYLARQSPQDAARALDAARRGATIWPDAPAACMFNLALAWEQLRDSREALAAWRQYLSTDGAGPWADEARQHISVLGGRSSISTPHDDYAALFEDALGAWARSVRGGGWSPEALLASSAAADRLTATTGDQFPAAVLRSIHESAGEQLRRLAAAHSLYAHAAKLQNEDNVTEATAAFRQSLNQLPSDAPFRAWVEISLIGVVRPADADDRLRLVAHTAEAHNFIELAGRAHSTLG